MLSTFVSKLIVYVLRACYLLGCTPFYLDKDFRIHNTETHIFRRFFNLSVIVFDALYVSFQFVRFSISKSTVPNRLFLAISIQYIFYIIAYVNIAFCTIHYRTKSKDVPNFLQNYFHFYRVSTTPKSSKYPKGFKKLELRKTFKLLLSILVVLSLQNVDLMMKKPDLPQILTSLLANPKEASLLQKLPFMAIYMYFLFSCWVSSKHYKFSYKIFKTIFHFLVLVTVYTPDIHVRISRLLRQNALQTPTIFPIFKNIPKKRRSNHAGITCLLGVLLSPLLSSDFHDKLDVTGSLGCLWLCQVWRTCCLEIGSRIMLLFYLPVYRNWHGWHVRAAVQQISATVEILS